MPNRIIREDILTSEAVDHLDFAAEIFYRRLLNKADDYGRYHANPKLLLANLYPLRTNDIKCLQIEKWLAQTVAAKLVTVYQNDGKLYLEVAKFKQQLRTPSKFPEPPAKQMHSNGEADAQQMHTLSVSVFEGVSEGEGECVSCDGRSSPASPKKEKLKVVAASRPESKEQCIEHCVQNLGLTENDGIALWEHWQGNGFHNKGSPMVSWRHVASNWARRRIFFPSLQDRKP